MEDPSREEMYRELEDPSREEIYREFFEQALYGCVISRMDGKFVLVNQAFADILGLTIEETLKLTYKNVTPIEYTEPDRKEIEELVRTGQCGPFEKTYIRKDESLVRIRLTLKLVEIGMREYIWSIVEEIPERRPSVLYQAAPMSLALYRALFQHAPVALAVCERDGRFVEVNQAYAELIGRTVDETLALKKGYWDITPQNPEAKAGEIAALEAIHGKGHYGPLYKEYLKKEGNREIPIEVTVQGVLLAFLNTSYIWSACYPGHIGRTPHRHPASQSHAELSVDETPPQDPTEPPSEKSVVDFPADVLWTPWRHAAEFIKVTEQEKVSRVPIDEPPPGTDDGKPA
jgi:PAS domain S-box-containing protein